MRNILFTLNSFLTHSRTHIQNFYSLFFLFAWNFQVFTFRYVRIKQSSGIDSKFDKSLFIVCCYQHTSEIPSLLYFENWLCHLWCHFLKNSLFSEKQNKLFDFIEPANLITLLIKNIFSEYIITGILQLRHTLRGGPENATQCDRRRGMCYHVMISHLKYKNSEHYLQTA